MSKKNKKAGSRFSYTNVNRSPKLKKIKTDWDLKSLYYKNEADPQIEKDIQKVERAYRAFAKKFRSADFTASAKSLHTALVAYEKLAAMPESIKPGRYFSFRKYLNAKDAAAEKHAIRISSRLQKASNEILFFELTIGKLPANKQKQYLRDPLLKAYRYFLTRVFLEAKHTLTEPEEKILNLKSNTAYSMWVNATEKIVSNRTLTFKKKQIPVNEALELIDTLPSKEKPVLWESIVGEMQKIGEVAENEFTAILNDAKIDDELRGYTKPYSATVLSYEDNEHSVEALVAAVSEKGFALSKQFYKSKAKYHGVPALQYAQKYDPVGTAATIPFTDAVDICRDVFYSLKQEYGAIFDRMLENGQIDVYPKAGKRGGAFMSSATNLPTHVFLNHTNTFNSLETLAHEMGHAIHSERSKQQPVFYEDHSITTAETASTLFENLVYERVYEQANEKEKVILLHDRITRDIATIQRQIAFFNTELEMHERVRTQGAVTNEELKNIMKKHLTSYLGNGVNVCDEDGYSYVYIPHFRYGFYVYTYTFGLLMSSIMARRYKEDHSYIREIDTFLTAGKSDTVENIFKQIGIQTKKIETFLESLSAHENDVRRFEKLTRSSSR